MFAPTLGCRFPVELDFGTVPPDMPEGAVPKPSEPVNLKISLTFKMGMFFSVLPCLSSMFLLPV
jgi:hypothetical protein